MVRRWVHGFRRVVFAEHCPKHLRHMAKNLVASSSNISGDSQKMYPSEGSEVPERINCRLTTSFWREVGKQVIGVESS